MRIGLIFLIIFLHGFLSAQCNFDVKEHISPNADFYLSGNVFGALSNDLADPMQGVCEVTLHFKHEYVSNLEVQLISPAGQIVTLVGFRNSNTLTSGSIWDVTFIPCSGTPVPDPGLPGQWSSIAPWNIGNSYTGSYHPAGGCLEDFNTGPVNGNWKVHITNGIFYEGDFLGFSIRFCDDSGLTCVPCEPVSSLMKDNSLNFCAGDSSLVIFRPDVIFPGGNPDSVNYYNDFVLFHNNIILDINDTLDLSQVPSGKYFIQFANYLKILKGKMDMYIGQNINDLYNDISSNVICAQLSVDSLEVNIFPSYNLPVKTIYLCQGDTFQLANELFLSDSLFARHFNTSKGCDSIVNLNLIFLRPTVFLQTDTVDCKDLVADIIIDSLHLPVNGQLLEIKWSDQSGNVILNKDTFSTTTGGMINLQIKALYQSIVCQWDTMIFVPNYLNLPPNPVIDSVNACSKMAFRISIRQDSLHTQAHWIVDGGELSNLSDTLVLTFNTAGTHQVCVYTSNICGLSDTICYSINVGSQPVYSLLYDSLTCDGSFSGHILASTPMLNWSNIGNTIIYNSDNQSFNAGIISGNSSGSVLVEGTIDGCDFIDTISVFKTDSLRISGITDTAICNAGLVQFNLSSSLIPTNLYYTVGGNSFTLVIDSVDKKLNIDVPGDTWLTIDSLTSRYSGCRVLVADSALIKVLPTPTAELSDTIELCNALNPNGLPQYDPVKFITSGFTSGLWNFNSIPGAKWNDTLLDVTNVLAGVYPVYYKIEPLLSTCLPFLDTLFIKIIDCKCNTPANIDTLLVHEGICTDSNTILSLNTFFNPDSAGQWSVWNKSVGSFDNVANGNWLVDRDSTILFLFRTDTDWAGACPDSVLIKAHIAFTVNAGRDSTFVFCQGDNQVLNLASLFGNAAGKGKLIAEPGDFKGLAAAIDPKSGSLDVSKLGAGNFILKNIIETNGICPFDTASIRVFINPLPVVTISGDHYLECKSLSGKLIASTSVGTEIEWYRNGILLPQWTGMAEITAIIAGMYSVTVTDSITSCASSYSFNVDTASSPITQLTIDYFNSCHDSLIQLHLSDVNGGVSLMRML